MTAFDERTDQPKEVFLKFANELAFFRLIGLEIVDLGAGWSEARLQPRPELGDGYQQVHTSAIATLIDSGIAYALLMTEAVAEARSFVSVDLRVKYYRRAPLGPLNCRSEIPRMSGELFHGRSEVTDAEGNLVAEGDSIYMITGYGDK